MSALVIWQSCCCKFRLLKNTAATVRTGALPTRGCTPTCSMSLGLLECFLKKHSNKSPSQKACLCRRLLHSIRPHGRARWLRVHAAVQPPSSINALPVMRLEASLAKKTMGPITSYTRPMRPSAILLMTTSRKAASANMGAVKAVSIKVGHTVLTRIPADPSSNASALVMPSTACFVAQ